MTESLERSFDELYFRNFFISQILIAKLFEKSVYAVDAVYLNRTKILKIIEAKKLKNGNCEFQTPKQ